MEPPHQDTHWGVPAPTSRTDKVIFPCLHIRVCGTAKVRGLDMLLLRTRLAAYERGVGTGLSTAGLPSGDSYSFAIV